MKNLTVNTLTEAIANYDNTNDLIFTVGGKQYMIRNAKVYLPEGTPTESEDYEFYWDDEANVDRAVREAKEIEEIS